MAEMGRPSRFTQQLADDICRKIADGMSLRRLCEEDGMPHRDTVREWLRKDRDFAAQYARAREEQADYYAEEIIEIADDGSHDYKTIIGKDGKEVEVVDHEHIQRSKLRVDARKWVASKLKARVYGNTVQPEGDAEDPDTVDDDNPALG